jgi:hypothetical protein
MKTISVDLDDELFEFVCADATIVKLEPSHYVRELLKDCMEQERRYRESQRRFFTRKPFAFQFVDGRFPTRDEIHDRASLR